MLSAFPSLLLWCKRVLFGFLEQGRFSGTSMWYFLVDHIHQWNSYIWQYVHLHLHHLCAIYILEGHWHVQTLWQDQAVNQRHSSVLVWRPAIHVGDDLYHVRIFYCKNLHFSSVRGLWSSRKHLWGNSSHFLRDFGKIWYTRWGHKNDSPLHHDVCCLLGGLEHSYCHPGRQFWQSIERQERLRYTRKDKIAPWIELHLSMEQVQNWSKIYLNHHLREASRRLV